MSNGTESQGLSGTWRHVSEWVWLAGQAGLPTTSYTQTSHDELDETKQVRRIVPDTTPTTMVVTLGDRVFGPTLPPHISAGCVQLAQLSKTPLLGIELTVGQSPALWTFAGATPIPTCDSAANRCSTSSPGSSISLKGGTRDDSPLWYSK
ncbi:MAG TPA: hypothetical protein VFZ22_02520 [Pyrinomonadaceae bacterium]|nr:hypothetical protein [Pyrinomonadaceae bacterium]